jgi:putative peptidoglycan lipid II flippase
VNETPQSANRQIARSASVVMAGFMLSSLAGLGSQILVSRAFGTEAELDAFYAANRIPELLFTIIAGGALSSAFLPTFTGFLTRDDREGAWRLTSSIANLVTITLGVISALAWVVAPWLVRRVLAPGFTDPAQIQLTISLLRVMLLTPVIFGLSGLLMATLNAQQHFALPALAPASYRLGWIIGVLAFVPRWGIHGLAWGTVLGAALHLTVQLPALYRFHPRYRPLLGLRDPVVHHVGKLMAPRLLGAAVVQINFLVNTIIASGQPEGSLTSINFALQIMIMPQAAIAQAIAIAALPTFSAQAARGQLSEMRRSLAGTLRGVLFLSLPASLGLILLRQPIIALLFQRGEFDAGSTRMVAWALLWYAAGLVGHALLEIIVRAFYAMHDTRTPVLVGAGAMGLNVVFSVAFSAGFARLGWAPHGGLALANSLATALECSLLLLLMRKRLSGLGLRHARKGLLGTLSSAFLMIPPLLLWLRFSGEANVFLVGFLGVLLGGAVYWTAALLLGVPEARMLPGLLLQRAGTPAPSSRSQDDEQVGDDHPEQDAERRF